MPKRSKKTQKRGAFGGVSQWPAHARLTYHLAECAMHLQMVMQIIGDAEEIRVKDFEALQEHRKQAGLRLRAMCALLEKRFPEMLRQPK